MKLSEELTKFLGVSSDTMMARTEVTKEINKYVKENDLQNPENRRELIMDAKLRTILTVKDGDIVTFFNLQRYMSPHYIKDTKVTSTEGETEEPKELVINEVTPPTEEPKRVKKVKKVKV
jgi:chromatin remodeling complex protein RSC6